MKRFLLLVVMAAVCLTWFTPFVCAQEEVPAEIEALPHSPLRFWGIGISEFYAQTPRAVSIPDTEGHLSYYWCMPFKFKVKTNLEKLDEYIEEKKPKLVDSDLVQNLSNYQEKIRETLKEAKHLPLYVVTHTGQGQILPDTSNRIVRNVVEKQVGRKLMTVKEIAEMDLHSVERTRDIDHGVGKWVYGVATFDPIEPRTRMFEVRVYGMGRRIVPHYEPGHILYPVEQLKMENSLNPSLRRCFRFFYRRIGQSGLPQLNTVRFEGREATWVWLWPPQIYLGTYRSIEIERRSGLGLKRRYFFAPYRIWNNTNDAQKIEVLKSGFLQTIRWREEPLKLTMYDIGEAESLWKTQVMRQIRQRLADGETERFVRENEIYDLATSQEKIKESYADFRAASGGNAPRFDESQGGNTLTYLQFDYYPKEEQRLREMFAKTIAGNPPRMKARLEALRDEHLNKLRAAQEEDKAALVAALDENPHMQAFLKDLSERHEADVKSKADILPTEEDRQFKGNVPPGKFVRGLVIVRFGVTDLETVVANLIYSLQAQALSGISGEGRPLLQAYLKMRPKNPYPERSWLQPPEPSEVEIKRMLVQLAQEDLSKAGVRVTEDDQRRYGEMAPIGAMLNHLAEQYMQKRASKNLIDTFFEVKWDGVIDRAMLVTNFKRAFPLEREQTRRHKTKLQELMREAREKARREREAAETGAGDGGTEGDDTEGAGGFGSGFDTEF